MLSKEETSRYSRHLLLPEIGVSGQLKLKSSKVLVIGAGGLGCPTLMYLTAAGVGEIGIVDFDKVDESNLQRQVLYTMENVCKSKADVAAYKLKAQNPFVNFKVYNFKLSTQNALSIIKNFDLVIDGTDNFSTRYLVNDACVLLDKPLIYGSIYRFEGQVSVFNALDKKGVPGPTYRCLFPVPPDAGSSPNCSEIGVLGVLPGMIGTMQANEAIKLITGVGEILSGKLLLINALTMDFTTIAFERNQESWKNIPLNEDAFLKTDYDFFCGITSSDNIKKISPAELRSWLSDKSELQLVDVREPGELPLVEELVDVHIPLGGLLEQSDKVSREKRVVVFCKSGMRSKRAIELLQDKFGFTNLYNLEGGLMKWIQEFQIQKK